MAKYFAAISQSGRILGIASTKRNARFSHRNLIFSSALSMEYWHAQGLLYTTIEIESVGWNSNRYALNRNIHEFNHGKIRKSKAVRRV